MKDDAKSPPTLHVQKRYGAARRGRPRPEYYVVTDATGAQIGSRYTDRASAWKAVEPQLRQGAAKKGKGLIRHAEHPYAPPQSPYEGDPRVAPRSLGPYATDWGNFADGTTWKSKDDTTPKRRKSPTKPGKGRAQGMKARARRKAKRRR